MGGGSIIRWVSCFGATEVVTSLCPLVLRVDDHGGGHVGARRSWFGLDSLVAWWANVGGRSWAEHGLGCGRLLVEFQRWFGVGFGLA